MYILTTFHKGVMTKAYNDFSDAQRDMYEEYDNALADFTPVAKKEKLACVKSEGEFIYWQITEVPRALPPRVMYPVAEYIKDAPLGEQIRVTWRMTQDEALKLCSDIQVLNPDHLFRIHKQYHKVMLIESDGTEITITDFDTYASAQTEMRKRYNVYKQHKKKRIDTHMAYKTCTESGKNLAWFIAE